MRIISSLLARIIGKKSNASISPTDDTILYSPENKYGNITLFDLLPAKAKLWNQGTIFWSWKTKQPPFTPINAGDTIGILHLQYTKKKDDISSIVVREVEYPIIAKVSGILQHQNTYYFPENGKIYTEGATYLDGSPIVNRGGNPQLFSLFANMTDVVDADVHVSFSTDPITKEMKINGFTKFKIDDRICLWLEGGQFAAYLLFHYNTLSTIQLKQIKTICILFNSNDVLSLLIDKKATTFEKNESMISRIRFSLEQLHLCSQHNIKLIRLLLCSEETIDLSIKPNYAEYFKEYAIKFIESLIKCGWKNESATEQTAQDEYNNGKGSTCYVYLMYDEANGFYKIGISNSPKYREHTLQSEKPTIVLIQAKQFPIRTIAEAFESALHKAYESKRLRGEWFKLEHSDVEDLKKALQ